MCERGVGKLLHKKYTHTQTPACLGSDNKYTLTVYSYPARTFFLLLNSIITDFNSLEEKRFIRCFLLTLGENSVVTGRQGSSNS